MWNYNINNTSYIYFGSQVKEEEEDEEPQYNIKPEPEEESSDEEMPLVSTGILILSFYSSSDLKEFLTGAHFWIIILIVNQFKVFFFKNNIIWRALNYVHGRFLLFLPPS